MACPKYRVLTIRQKQFAHNIARIYSIVHHVVNCCFLIEY